MGVESRGKFFQAADEFRRRGRKTFGRYVTKEVGNSILEGDMKFPTRTVNGTILYVYHKGFNEIMAGLEPELGRQELAARLDAIIEPSVKVGGTREAPDQLRAGVIVVFNQIENALIAAANIRRNLTVLNEERHIRFGMGIATGEFEIGDIGNNYRSDYFSTGRPLQEAFRLAREAANSPFEVLISDSALQAIGPLKTSAPGRI